MIVIKHRHLFYIFSGFLVFVSIGALVFYGLPLGIDFTGGTIAEVEFIGERPSVEALRERLSNAGFSEVRLQPSGEKSLILRLHDITEEEHQALLVGLANSGVISEILEEKRFDSIGPIIGKELLRKAVIAIGLVILLILVFVSWAFRKVSEPVQSWKYALTAIVALGHDVMIPVGLFVILGRFFGAEGDALFVTALLTILGFSVHDTIVVFDRIRENLSKAGASEDFASTVGKSLRETVGRSLATSFTLFLMLASLFWFGAEAIRYFALTLLVGVVAGTYSSICLASPLIVTWNDLDRRRKRALT